MGLNVGDQAPDFTLKQKTADGLDDVSLNDYKGKQNVVLLFFPLAYTSVCTDEMCSVSQGLSDYEALNAKVLGISVDSPFAQEAWAKENDISIPLLSDFNKDVSAKYGAQYDDLLGLFGSPASAVGFSLSAEALVELLHPFTESAERIDDPDEEVLVRPSGLSEGFEEALKRRRFNKSARIVKKDG